MRARRSTYGAFWDRTSSVRVRSRVRGEQLRVLEVGQQVEVALLLLRVGGVLEAVEEGVVVGGLADVGQDPGCRGGEGRVDRRSVLQVGPVELGGPGPGVGVFGQRAERAEQDRPELGVPIALALDRQGAESVVGGSQEGGGPLGQAGLGLAVDQPAQPVQGADEALPDREVGLVLEAEDGVEQVRGRDPPGQRRPRTGRPGTGSARWARAPSWARSASAVRSSGA